MPARLIGPGCRSHHASTSWPFVGSTGALDPLQVRWFDHLAGMSDYMNHDAIAWVEENERLHRQGEPHQWRLFGMIACRLCQADHDPTARNKKPETGGTRRDDRDS